MALREWRCYTGECDDGDKEKAERIQSTTILNWVEPSHTKELCYSGISCLKLNFNEKEVFGGVNADCELR